MKKFKFFGLLLLFLLLLAGAGRVMAAEGRTQGDAALQLASMLGLNNTSKESAVAALQSAGITPPGGWNINAPVTNALVSQIFSAVNSAISAGRVTAPAGLGNASAIVAATFAAIGMPGNTVVNSIVAAGGDPNSARQGATLGPQIASTGPFGASGPSEENQNQGGRNNPIYNVPGSQQGNQNNQGQNQQTQVVPTKSQ